jgi:peptide subunit release factor 1 (eRF1)
MLTREEIERLEAFDGGERRALSLYLDLDPMRQVRRSYRAAFEDLVKEARERLERRDRGDLAREVAEVETVLEREHPNGKGLVIFSCTPRLWKAYWVPPRVADHLAFEPRLDVAPLLALVDEYERYTVALVDKRRLRLFSVFLGAIEERQAVEDADVFGKHDQGGLSQTNFQRHHEAHVYRHLQRVARALTELLRRRPFDRLILAGPDEPTSELRHLLPRPLAQRLVAVVPAEITATAGEILGRTLEVERAAERDVEMRLLSELIETAGSRGRAILGVEPTLDALWAGKVQTLVAADDVHRDGSECTVCGRLEPGTLAACPLCGNRVRPAHDLLHRAMARTLELAGSVEVVHAAAAARLREAGDGLGARLRYR